MSARRLMGTTAAMGAMAAALALLTPALPEMTGTVLAAQRTADTAGAETLLLAAVGLTAWAVWAWGALGLLLTAASALPGVLGSAADLLTRVLLPAGARRSAALALGLGLGIAAPVGGTALLLVTAPAAVAGPTAGVPDWPVAAPLPDPPPVPSADTGTGTGTGTGTVPERTAVAVPDWPEAPGPPAAGHHVVVRGDCLWGIAAGALSDRLGRTPTGTETAAATQAWWAANAAVIGPDPDLLLPGQVLRPPP